MQAPSVVLITQQGSPPNALIVCLYIYNSAENAMYADVEFDAISTHP